MQCASQHARNDCAAVARQLLNTFCWTRFAFFLLLLLLLLLPVVLLLPVLMLLRSLLRSLSLLLK